MDTTDDLYVDNHLMLNLKLAHTLTDTSK